MKRNLLAAMMAFVLLLTACGGGDMAAADTEVKGDAFYTLTEESMDIEMNTSGSSEPMADSAGGGNNGGSVYRDANAKLIRTAELRIQTTEFDTAVEELEVLVADLGGYFERAAFHGGGYRNANARRSGEYTIRVPAEKYEDFLNQSGDLGYVTYRNEDTEDIGERYYDTESRLKTQKIKQERLLSLLEKAATMEDIITLENALSEVEYQIEQFSSTLNRYDSLVGFATIHLTLDEEYKVTEEPGVTDSLGHRMSVGFASSVDSLITGAQDLLVWLSYNLFGLLIFGGAVGLGGALIVGKVKKRRQRKAEKNTENQ